MTGCNHSPKPIADYMAKHELSQKQFADLMGVSQSAVSQWLTCKKGLSMSTATRMQKRTKGEVEIRALFPRLFATSERQAA